ncbi:MAG: YggS family pyridoxal phosphate-dependent enzyme, partial [Candidatus Promineifilaceae bacterium]|nr:YggS family pyridoxal phosphate-dependent enzyme [Candidatus Promineifilaceae bacterium]
NRAGELSEKRPEVEAILGAACADIVWHAIGDLQSRKTSMVAEYAHVFHALDRLKIARRLSRHLVEAGQAEERPLPVFLEVNVSGEDSKAGFDCSNWEQDDGQRKRLVEVAQTVAELPGLRPQGLMTMAPWQVDAPIIRDVFRRTRELAEWLQAAAPLPSPEATWSKLSMGMTDDYEMAVEEGATHLRVGRAIFGERR